jgi:hypothetical protein
MIYKNWILWLPFRKLMMEARRIYYYMEGTDMQKRKCKGPQTIGDPSPIFSPWRKRRGYCVFILGA